MAKFNYIRENSLLFSKMIYEIIDNTDSNNWRDDEHRNEFKYSVVAEYIKGLADLISIDVYENNPINSHISSAESYFKLCERYKVEGNKCFEGKEDRHLELLSTRIKDWIDTGLVELRNLERIHHTKLAFDYKDNPTPQLPNHLQQLRSNFTMNMSKRKFENNINA
jgi:hypothetical protein